MMRSEDIRDRLKDIEEFLLKQYKENKVETKRDWQTYEQQLMNRIKGAIRNLEPLIKEARSCTDMCDKKSYIINCQCAVPSIWDDPTEVCENGNVFV